MQQRFLLSKREPYPAAYRVSAPHIFGFIESDLLACSMGNRKSARDLLQRDIAIPRNYSRWRVLPSEVIIKILNMLASDFHGRATVRLFLAKP